MRIITGILTLFMLGGATLTAAPILPPLRPWNGRSEALARPPAHQWAAPVEKSGFRTSPTLGEIDAWYQQLAAATQSVKYLTAGTSPQNRPIRLVVVSKEGASTPGELAASGRPTVLAQGGIHAGEIDGSDAGMMLIRDLTVTGRLSDLLESVNFLLIPVLNVDGHARASEYSRINQRGPEVMGWRTNAQNLNLNRDYSKLDTSEVRTVLKVIRDWGPLLYLDLHVTDGSDYQYDITWGWNASHAWSPNIASWIDRELRPQVDSALTSAGHSPGRLVFEVDGRFPDRGMVEWTAPPRFSHGWGDAAHVPAILVENHSLKPFRRRVLGTYVLLESVLQTVGRRHASLDAAVAADRSRRKAEVPLEWSAAPGDPPTIAFPAFETRSYLSEITGDVVVEYLEKPKDWSVPLIRETNAAVSATRPKAYWIPAQWTEVIERIEAHGIEYSRNIEERQLTVRMYRLTDPSVAGMPFEGRTTVDGSWSVEERIESFPPGSVRIAVDQPLGTLAMLLLEPGSPDSFVRWGFFNSVLSRTEYVEAYVMEPMARRMLQDDAIAAEFRQAIRDDATLRSDSNARLQWFYRRTPYWDDRFNLYPVAREE